MPVSSSACAHRESQGTPPSSTGRTIRHHPPSYGGDPRWRSPESVSACAGSWWPDESHAHDPGKGKEVDTEKKDGQERDERAKKKRVMDECMDVCERGSDVQTNRVLKW